MWINYFLQDREFWFTSDPGPGTSGAATSSAGEWETSAETRAERKVTIRIYLLFYMRRAGTLDNTFVIIPLVFCRIKMSLKAFSPNTS